MHESPAPSGAMASANADANTVAGFGDEWAAFDQASLAPDEWRAMFDRYFAIFPWDGLPPDAEGFDLGCGSGRWAAGAVARVGLLHCIDPADAALDVARRRLRGRDNVRFHAASVDAIPLADASQDFGYSLGVLHHVPDTRAALRDCVAKLKPGAPFLLYLYYAFDNRPAWYRLLWRGTDAVRRGVSRLPFRLRKGVTDGLAVAIYWPLARGCAALERAGLRVDQLPLASYRHLSFYTMRTDALDRFGTRLEQRFTRAQIGRMMADAGLEDIVFSDAVPYWVALGRRREG
ncbi:class I SAM-dependent methyltransferase [Sphingomonas hengshuiensis]|nr:class I SAM-dependent methyltransferase [Sphingomonas hengshuiensis]